MKAERTVPAHVRTFERVSYIPVQGTLSLEADFVATKCLFPWDSTLGRAVFCWAKGRFIWNV